MRPLEIIIPLLLAIHLVWRYPRPSWMRLAPAAALLVTVIHFAIEGYRWQMIPLYVLTSIFGLSTLLRIRSSGDWKPLASHLTLRLAQGGAVFLLAVSTILPIVLPVPSIPAPDGPYQVGTTIYELTDTSRAELYSGRDEARRFQIQVWYPSEPGPTDERAAWMNHADVFGRSISADILGLPPFFLDHLSLVKLPAYRDSRVAPTVEGYPVILFSHGWNGFNAQNSGQALQLASHGFVVLGVQHTHGAVVTVFDDGTTVQNNPAALPIGAPDEEYDIAARLLADQWAGDLGYALDFMEEQNDDSSSPFHNTLEPSLVGVYGHSTGGGAAIQFCGTDARCKAILGQDPFMRPVSGEVLDGGVTQPSFFMFSQRWADDKESLNNRLFNPFYANSKEAVGAVSIEGTAHYDFSDLPLLSPLTPQLGLKGPINGKRVTTIVDDYLLSFFEMTLKGISSDLFEAQNQKYEEVKFAPN
jgi:predicted dienelactone hydrolase